MKVADIKLFLQSNYNIKLKSNAKKADYVEKLKEVVEKKVPFCTHRNEAEMQNMAVGGIFDGNSYWKELIPHEEVDDDGLVVDGEEFYEPTGEEGVSIRVKKRNYSNTFDRSPFTQQALMPKKDTRGIVLFCNGKAKYEMEGIEQTTPNIEFLHKNGIFF